MLSYNLERLKRTIKDLKHIQNNFSYVEIVNKDGKGSVTREQIDERFRYAILQATNILDQVAKAIEVRYRETLERGE